MTIMDTLTIPADSALTAPLRKLATKLAKARDARTDAEAEAARLDKRKLTQEAEAADTRALAEGGNGTPAADELAEKRRAAKLAVRATTEQARLAEEDLTAALRANRNALVDLTLEAADKASAAYLEAVEALLTARNTYTAACTDYAAAVLRKVEFDRPRARIEIRGAARRAQVLTHPTNWVTELQAHDLAPLLRHDAHRHDPTPTVLVSGQEVPLNPEVREAEATEAGATEAEAETAEAAQPA